MLFRSIHLTAMKELQDEWLSGRRASNEYANLARSALKGAPLQRCTHHRRFVQKWGDDKDLPGIGTRVQHVSDVAAYYRCAELYLVIDKEAGIAFEAAFPVSGIQGKRSHVKPAVLRFEQLHPLPCH